MYVKPLYNHIHHTGSVFIPVLSLCKIAKLPSPKIKKCKQVITLPRLLFMDEACQLNPFSGLYSSVSLLFVLINNFTILSWLIPSEWILPLFCKLFLFSILNKLSHRFLKYIIIAVQAWMKMILIYFNKNGLILSFYIIFHFGLGLCKSSWGQIILKIKITGKYVLFSPFLSDLMFLNFHHLFYKHSKKSIQYLTLQLKLNKTYK